MENINKAIEWQKAFKKTYNGTPEEVNEMCDLAISALEKQIPKEPLRSVPYGPVDEYEESFLCPNCKHLVGYYKDEMDAPTIMQYCTWCGQKLSEIRRDCNE